ncbi:MAG: peptidoglycan DD-metalloendopeptidase family protein [Gemmatimonadetes bacterium]|nr:peptidoglycan DD-metalloendopeptidase family protein [Gemmatimonadota bacterium]
MRLALAVAVVLLAAPTNPAVAQRRNIDRQLRNAQSRLDSIRQERSELEDQLRRLRGRARDIATELGNLNQQRTSTGRIVNELDRQLASLSPQLDTMTAELLLVQDALAEKQAVVERRVVAIHKRGPLWAFQVLLGAQSFGELLRRYKYLYLVSRQDRTLVNEIGTLHERLANHRRDLLTVQTQIASQRTERNRELGRYATLERERQRALSQTQRREQQTTARVDLLARDDERLNDLIASLERSRRSGGLTLAAPSIAASDVGRLDWPLGGEVIYQFGQQPFEDRTTITRLGIGIRAPVGTTVSAVRSGVVAFAEPVGTWGPTVMLDHGDGYYTVYTYLSRLDVTRNALVTEGQPIGLSGGINTDEGPHLGFQIRQTPPGTSNPIPLDPLNWLKRR